MKTQTHTPWIEGKCQIKKVEAFSAVHETNRRFKNFNAENEFIKSLAAKATYITDQFIIGMIRSAKRG